MKMNPKQVARLPIALLALCLLPAVAGMAVAKDWDTKELLEEVTVLLRGPTPIERCQAASRLGQMNDKRSAMALIAVAGDADASVRHCAIRALGRLIPRLSEEFVDQYANGPLIRALADRDAEVREAAADALGYAGNTVAIEPLVRTLRDPVPRVRRIAAVSLGKIEDRRAAGPLTVALKDEQPFVRSAALGALNHLKEHGTTGSIDPGQIDSGQIATNDAATLMVLVAMLDDPDRQVRMEAITGLVDLGDQRAVDPLVRHMNRSQGETQWKAAWALGELGDPRAVPPLIAAAVPSSNRSLRANALKSLGRLGDQRAVHAINVALNNSEWFIQNAALRAAENVHNDLTLELIRPLCSAESVDTRSRALWTLYTLRAPDAVAQLAKAAVNDPDRDVRINAALRLRDYVDRDGPFPGQPDQRQLALEALDFVEKNGRARSDRVWVSEE
jgi:HEAT repeat protein